MEYFNILIFYYKILPIGTIDIFKVRCLKYNLNEKLLIIYRLNCPINEYNYKDRISALNLLK